MYICFNIIQGADIEKHIFDSDREDLEMPPCFSSLSNILTTPFELLRPDFAPCSPRSKAHRKIESSNVFMHDAHLEKHILESDRYNINWKWKNKIGP